MKDERGLYYYPTLQTRDTRMYVREEDGEILFRLWSRENPVIWDRHGWLPMDMVKQAAEMYKNEGRDRNPLALYDIDVARKLIDEDKDRS